MRKRYNLVGVVMLILAVVLLGCTPTGADDSFDSPLGTPSSDDSFMTPDATDDDMSTPDTGMVTPDTGATPGAETTPGLPGTGSSVPAEIEVAEDDTLGEYLTDGQGQALYVFTEDTEDTSNCTDACAETWPPLTTGGDALAGSDVDESMLGTITRSDGTTQVTYNGMPLYYYRDDMAAGDTNGQGLNDKWYLVSPDGEMIEK